MSDGYLPVDGNDNDIDSSAGYQNQHSKHSKDGDSDGEGFSDNENEDPFNRRKSIRFNRDYYGLGTRIADVVLHGGHGGDHLLDHGKTELTGWASIWLAYQSIGALYGDVGTNPLYVFSSTFATPPPGEDLIGVLSLITWALILIATIKYVGIVLCANDKGEGGSFALFSLIQRYVSSSSLKIRQTVDIDNQNRDASDFLVNDDEKQLRPFNLKAMNLLKRSSRAKKVVKVFAVLGVYGALTPAQSILAAVQGLQIAAPNIETHTLVAIACVLIIFLFALQPFGTSKLSSFFTPIVIVWLMFNVISGVYGNTGLVAMFCAPLFAPHVLWSGRLYQRPSRSGREPTVQISAPGDVLAALSALNTDFDCCIPSHAYGDFSTHTTKLGNAYGTCVVVVGFITTWLVALVSTIIWNVHVVIVMPIFLFFVSIDGLFVSSALYKVPSGGWFTIAMAVILSSTLLAWNYGEECQLEADRDESSLSRARLFGDTNGTLFIREGDKHLDVKTIRGIGIFLVETDLNSPPVFDHFLRKFEASHEITVLLHINRIPKYHVAPSNRLRSSATPIRGVYRVTLCLGYGDTISWVAFEQSLIDELEMLISNNTAATPPTDAETDCDLDPHQSQPLKSSSPRSPLSFQLPRSTSSGDIPLSIMPTIHTQADHHQHEQLAPPDLKAITQKPITYIICRDKLFIKEESNFVRRAILTVFVAVRNQQRAKLSQLEVPADRLVEIGFSRAV
ncbi:potassium transporter hak-1 [Histoplasma capsulatum H143]|uniref:Potassium transporter hak-1 n=1 Tax=Ajellomyces capsulatus (strain H143) TaxID=544712 RepID=C6HDA2_AJECH|nr:potassium transporter hak-1 [Histoplasma capsulatum H143]